MRTQEQRWLRGATISIVSAIAVCSAATAQQADSPSLNVDMSQCVELGTEAERVACYQQQVADALAARESGAAMPAPSPAPVVAAPAAPAAPAPNAATAAPQPTAAANTNTGMGARQGYRQDYSDEPEFSGTITNLRETIPDRWVITLDNGQVWQMNQSKRYPLRVGLDVRVYPTRWGPSYRLSAPDHGGYVQVRRAR